MKRILFLILAVFSITAYGKTMKVVSGKASVLKKDVTANVIFSFEGTTWERGSRLTRQLGDEYDEDLEAAKDAFISTFNTENVGMKVKESDEDAQYTITIHALDFFQKVGSFYRKFLRVDADIEIKDNQTGTVVCEIMVRKYDGDSDYTDRDRFGKCYNELAHGLANLKIK